MATTTNYAWVTPDNTDLVKDGALAIRTLGSSIDTTTKALNPSTTLGDIEYRSATANTNTRLAVGTTGQVLTVAAGVPSWATPGGAAGLTKITSATFSAVSSVSFPTSTFSSTYKDYLIEFEVTTCSASMTIQGRFRASGADNTTSNYQTITQGLTTNGAASNTTNLGQTLFTVGYLNSGADQFSRTLNFVSPQLAVKTKVWGGGVGVNAGFTERILDTQALFFDATTQFDSFTFIASTGNFTGRYAVYGLEA
jgi:hypothetical protein